jgi:hypothetical protein
MAERSMKRMPTSNVPGVHPLHDLPLIEAPVLLLASGFNQAYLLQQRFGLFSVCLQRYMRLLHTFLLKNIVGFKEQTEVILSNCSECANQCQVYEENFTLLAWRFFDILSGHFGRRDREVVSSASSTDSLK